MAGEVLEEAPLHHAAHGPPPRPGEELVALAAKCLATHNRWVSFVVTIRPATSADAAAIAAIYAHHVLHGTATFDTVPPTSDDWHDKITAIVTRGWPILTAEIDGEIAGYAYAVAFRDRPAYAETCENSIYIAHDKRGARIGTALMQPLLDASAACGFAQMIAVVGGGEPASVALHEKFSFRHVGRLHHVGRKFGRLLDTVYLQRALKDEE